MREKFKSFFGPDMNLSPFGGNDILYTSEYCSLAKGDDQLNVNQVKTLLSKINPIVSIEDWSRDNHIGYICLSKKFGLDAHKQFYKSNIKYMLQPGDFIFFIWAMGGLRSLMVLPFLPITSIAMILTVLITEYKTINGQQVLATDGQLLTYLSINTFNLPFTKYICDKIIKHKYGSYAEIAKVYFGEAHPVYILMKEQSV